MGIFDKETEEKAEAMKKEIIKGKEFEQGLVLKALSVEKVKGQFGAAEDSRMVESGILEESEQFVYKFMDEEGLTRRHYSTSMPLFRGFTGAEIEPGDWVSIKREGNGQKTKYTVKKVEHGDVQPAIGHRGQEGVKYPEGPNPDEIPF